jgi:hypothetical protein
MSDTKEPFYLQRNSGFAEYRAEDDSLHPQTNNREPGDSLTETQFLGFNIPEENIHGLGYLWHHPNLGVLTGGAWAFQGIKKHILTSELFDFRAYMSDRVLTEDLRKYRLANGYGVQVHEPLKALHMTYADPSRKNEIDIQFSAITPPVMFGSGMHFEQGMKTTGQLTLRGKRYEVNGFTIRDRSWGQLRPEDAMPLPPMTWMTGVFNENFMFNCSAFDHPRADPEWNGVFDLPEQAVLKGGWIYRDGRVTEIKTIMKRTVHDPETLYPDLIEMEITDTAGQHFNIKGKITAGCAWAAWPNFTFPVCQARWECDGLVGYGDAQEAQWPDFVRAFYGKLGK